MESITEYTTSTAKQLEWMNVDIGVATVQQPYDFNDLSYLIHCSYVPESIMINYDKSMEVENSRAIALGWGGKKAEGVSIFVKVDFTNRFIPFVQRPIMSQQWDIIGKIYLCFSLNVILNVLISMKACNFKNNTQI